jgi:hypothetical protein
VEGPGDAHRIASHGEGVGQAATQLRAAGAVEPRGASKAAVEPVRPAAGGPEGVAATVVESAVDVEPASEVAPRRKPGRPINPLARRFNAVLRALIRDDDLDVGDTAALLSVVTGLDYEEIRRRVDEAEHRYSDEEKTGRAESDLSGDEFKYLATAYSRSRDPAVKSWLESIRRARSSGR